MNVLNEASKRCLLTFTASSLCLLLTLCQSHSANAQVISDSSAHRVVQQLARQLTENYPFPELSKQYRNELVAREKQGAYYNQTADNLASLLNTDLQRTHRDVHLHVVKDEALFKQLTQVATGDAKAEDDTSQRATSRRKNYGFQQVALDPITSTAYINIPGPFEATQESFEMAAAVMNVAAYSHYIIFDLRFNPGGAGEIDRFLASYFYEAGDEKFYLNGFYKDRLKDAQEWTYSYVPGRRNEKAKVYMLVGRETGSAAEGFAYATQKLQRATVVGDTTAGAGIAGSYAPLQENLSVFLPFKMVVGPNTTAGWEGVGVIPDVLTGSEDALAATHKVINQDILHTAPSAAARAAIQWLSEDQQVAPGMAAGSKRQYATLPGSYTNQVTIVADKLGLWWQRAEPGKARQRLPLQEVKPDVFAILNPNKTYGPANSRIYLTRNASGRIVSLTRKSLLNDGSIRSSALTYQKLAPL